MFFLKQLLKRLFNDQRGLALVLVSAGMLAFMGFLALVSDVGIIVLNKHRLSNAVDAAALAGAQELPAHPEEAVTTAVIYALKNGSQPENPLISPYEGHQNSMITVKASREVNLFFARAFGQNSATVTAQAAARVAGIKSFKGAAPLAIPKQNFDFNTRYILKQGANSPDPSPLGPGNYGALSMGGSGADTYRDNLKYGYMKKLSVGDVVNTETGNMSGPTKDAIDYRMDLCNHSPPCSYLHFDPGCPRILIIPVYEFSVIEKGQVKQIKIVGFSAFLVDRVTAQGNENYIEGYFIRMVADGESGQEQTDFGLQGVKLVE
ncbi:MAG: pilus assembly protein TadG-related protein [Eubacteriales bacterium]